MKKEKGKMKKWTNKNEKMKQHAWDLYKGVPHMTQGKPWVKVVIVGPPDVQALFNLPLLPIVFFVQDSGSVPFNSVIFP